MADLSPRERVDQARHELNMSLVGTHVADRCLPPDSIVLTADEQEQIRQSLRKVRHFEHYPIFGSLETCSDCAARRLLAGESA